MTGKTSTRKTIHCFVKWIEEEDGSAVANKVFEEGGVLQLSVQQIQGAGDPAE